MEEKMEELIKEFEMNDDNSIGYQEIIDHEYFQKMEDPTAVLLQVKDFFIDLGFSTDVVHYSYINKD